MAILRKRQEEDLHGLGAEARVVGREIELTIIKEGTGWGLRYECLRKSMPGVVCMLRPQPPVLLSFPQYPYGLNACLISISLPSGIHSISVSCALQFTCVSPNRSRVQNFVPRPTPCFKRVLRFRTNDAGKDPRQTSPSDRSPMLTCDITIT